MKANPNLNRYMLVTEVWDLVEGVDTDPKRDEGFQTFRARKSSTTPWVRFIFLSIKLTAFLNFPSYHLPTLPIRRFHPPKVLRPPGEPTRRPALWICLTFRHRGLLCQCSIHYNTHPDSTVCSPFPEFPLANIQSVAADKIKYFAMGGRTFWRRSFSHRSPSTLKRAPQSWWMCVSEKPNPAIFNIRPIFWAHPLEHSLNIFQDECSVSSVLQMLILKQYLHM